MGRPAFYRQIAQASPDAIAEAEAHYAPMSCPVRLIWGQEDTFIPIERAHRLAERLGAPAVRAIPEAAHLVQEDAPEALLAALLDPD